MTTNTPGTELPELLPTISTFSVNALHFADEAYARQLAANVWDFVREISKHLDLSTLDGVTIAQDYHAALAQIDFGYHRSAPPVPTTEGGTGVAMHLGVLRDGVPKSHIVLHAPYFSGLHTADKATTALSLHTLFHECAHVEVAAMFEACFPGRGVNPRYLGPRDNYRWQSTLASWDEYAACRLSSAACPNGDGHYGSLLIEAIDRLPAKIGAARTELLIGGDLHRFMVDLYTPCSDVMRFAAYNLGHLHGRGLSLADLPELSSHISNSVVKPFIDRLEAACLTLWSGYGKWSDDSEFRAIGDIADDMVALGGLKYGADQMGRDLILPIE